MTDTGPKNDQAPNDPSADAPKDDASKAADNPTPELPDPAADFQKQAAKWERQAKNDAAALAALKKKMAGLLTPEQVQDKDQEVREASRDRDDARAEALRLRVALRKGLPEDLADRLRGATEEELLADADKLAGWVKQGSKDDTRRVPDAGAGTGKQAAFKTTDPNALMRAAVGL